MTIIGTKWVFRKNLDENGIVSQNKSMLVAQGYNQQEGIDYDETYALVARLESIRILLAYACTLDFKLFQIDVKSVFLNSFINEEVYMELPLGFIDFEKPDHIYKLKKALYGLKQAPKAYGETQSEAIKLLIFPFSLCDEAKTWFNELNEESITSWEQMRKAFINKFFPPSLFNRLLLEIRNFSQLLEASNSKNGFLNQSLKEELQDMRNKYNELREGNASKNHMNDDTPMCERHEVNYIQSEEYQNRNSHDSYSHQSYHDPNDSEKSLTELNNDVKNDLEDFKRCICSMRTVHDKLFDRDDGKTTGVLPNKKSKPINQEPQSKTDFEKLMTKFLDDQRVTSMFFKNNVNDMILKIKQNEKNFQIKIKKMERKMDEWSKSQNISSEQTDRTEPQPPPQAHTEQVNVVFTGSGKSDDPSKTQKDSPPPIIVNNKIKKDKPIKTTKKAIMW
ncbi:reverse transcriptase domain-containing protein [Tanacetum coccineum]